MIIYEILLLGIILMEKATSLNFNEDLFLAIREQESSLRVGVPRGDRGRSRGPYQICRDYWKDGIRYGGVDWDYDKWVDSRARSEQVMLWYWKRYNAQSDEEKARMHNGGPRGHLKESTVGYWLEVRIRLSRIKEIKND